MLSINAIHVLEQSPWSEPSLAGRSAPLCQPPLLCPPVLQPRFISWRNSALCCLSVQELRVHSTELRNTKQAGAPRLALDGPFLSDSGDWAALVRGVVLLPPEGWDSLTTRKSLPFQLPMSMRFKLSAWLYISAMGSMGD